MELPNPYYLSPQRRALCLEIVGDQQRTKSMHLIAHRLYFLDDHFPPNKLDRALKWLVSHQIVGQTFIKWIEEVCKNSDLEMHRILLSIVDNEALGHVVAGKNFKL